MLSNIGALTRNYLWHIKYWVPNLLQGQKQGKDVATKEKTCASYYNSQNFMLVKCNTIYSLNFTVL